GCSRACAGHPCTLPRPSYLEFASTEILHPSVLGAHFLRVSHSQKFTKGHHFLLSIHFLAPESAPSIYAESS
ncbi:hypothetical protein QR98_0003540, partial [Sarcoptes scabiei]